MQTLLLTQRTNIVCLGVLLIQITKTVFGTHASLHTLGKNWLTFIAEPTASVPLVQKSSNGRDPELLLFTSHAYSLPSWLGARMWFYQQVSVIDTFCRHV